MLNISEKEIKCPVCNVPINWKPTDRPNVLRGNCPKCGMKFTNMSGNIISDPKVS